MKLGSLKLPLLFAYLLSLNICVTGQDTKTIIDKPVHKFNLELILQSTVKEINDIQALKGKLVILEFWATWCAPCIAQMPHLDELSDKFRKQPVQFISITYESKEIVDRFLKRRKMNSWIGLDLDTSILKSLNIRSYPTTVVIDKNGIVRKVLMPQDLTQGEIERYLSGDFSEIKPEKPASSINSSKPSNDAPVSNPEKPVFYVTMKDSKYTSGMGGGIPGRIDYAGISLKALLSRIYNLPEYLVRGDTSLLNKHYDISAELPTEKKLFDEILQKAVLKAAKIKAEMKEDDISYHKLGVHSGGTKNIFISSGKGNGHGSTDNGIVGTSNFPLSYFVSFLEDALFTMIEDNTGLKEKYDFNFYYTEGNTYSIVKGLEEQLGLILEPATKRVNILFVTKKEGK